MDSKVLGTRFLWMVLLLWISASVKALTLNPLIEAPDGHRLVNQQPLLFNEQIIFVTEKDDDYSLWSFDLTDHSYTTLQVFDQFNPSQEFHVIDEFFYFRDYNEPSRIWRSDGTPSGTNPVPGLITFKGSYLQPQNNLLFAQWGGDDSDTDIVGFDGESYRNYGVQYHPFEKAVCAFSLNDVIIPSTNVYAGNDHYLVRYTDQNSTDYTNDLPDDFNVYGIKVWQFEDKCFYYITGQNFYDILVIPEAGEKFFLGEGIGFSKITQVTRFKDSYYAIGTDADGVDQLIKLSSDLSQVEKKTQSEGSFYFKSLTVSDRYLIANADSGPYASPTIGKTTYFDENLNVVEGLGGVLVGIPDIYPRYMGETVVFKDNSQGLYQRIIATDIDDKDAGLTIKNLSLTSVIVSENSSETYALLRDLITGEYRVYKLEELPDMGFQSVGNWFDPNYKNQGLNVVEGQRQDGSYYLFVTLYLFRDAQPLWLAGMSNLNVPQKDLSFLVGEYDGIGLFEPNTIPNETVFGEVQLSMSGCNQMAATVTTTDMQVFTVDLQRMENTLVNHLCKD